MRLELSDAQRRTMVDTGKAFYTIREKRLYREEYPTFEDYVREKWRVPMEYVQWAIDFYLADQN